MGNHNTQVMKSMPKRKRRGKLGDRWERGHAILTVRVSVEQHRLMCAVCARDGMLLSELVRGAIRSRLRAAQREARLGTFLEPPPASDARP